jgi:D-galactarolactone cycloisomerase
VRIKSIECIPVGWPVEGELRWGRMAVRRKGAPLIRVTTDDGVEGIGEAGFSIEFFRSVSVILEGTLVPALLDENPLDVERLWRKMMDLTHLWGRRGMETYAVSGVEIALWDIVGKVAGMPIHRLLGTYQESIPAYAAPSLRLPVEVARDCEKAIQRGFRAVKLRTGLDPVADVEIVRTARQTVGDRVALMVDGNSAYDLATAVRLASRFGEDGIEFLEEPLKTNSLPAYIHEHAELARRISIPLAGGECLFTHWEFAELVNSRAFAILQPDCTGSGGIGVVKKIAAMGDAAGLKCIPHIACSSGTGVGFAAALQVIASLPNCPWIEYDAYEDPIGGKLLKNGFSLVDGKVHVPTGPGLGVEIDEGRLKAVRLDQ